MINDSNSILKIISDLKSKKVSVQKVETKLKISNGLLGKAAKCKTKLSDEKFEKLYALYIKFSPAKDIEKSLGDLKDKVTTGDKVPSPKSAFDTDKIYEQIERLKILEKIEKFCSDEGITPEELIEGYKSKKPTKKESKKKEIATGNTEEPLVQSKSYFRDSIRKAKCGI